MSDSSPLAVRASSAGAQVALVLGTFAAAAVGAWASIDAQDFYRALHQPAWAPPASVFGPVWTVLYLLMAVAACGVVRDAGVHAARGALAGYAAQLALNAAWTWLFFHWHLGAWAFAEVLVLLGAVGWTMVRFHRIRAWTAICLAPYLAWVTFASGLTWAMWRLNPTVL